MSKTTCMTMNDLKGRVGDMLGSDYIDQELNFAIDILKENGYTVGEHTKPELYSKEMRGYPATLDDVNDFWPDNMFDLILNKQKESDEEIENSYSFLDTDSYSENIVNNFCNDDAVNCRYNSEYIYDYLVDVYFIEFCEKVYYKRETYYILNYYDQYTQNCSVLINIKDKKHLEILKGYADLCLDKNIDNMQYDRNMLEFLRMLKFDRETIRIAINNALSLDIKDFLNLYKFEKDSDLYDEAVHFFELVNENK